MKNLKIIGSAVAGLALLLLAWVVVPPPHSARAQFPGQATYAGTSGGSANAQTLTVANVVSLTDIIGVPITFTPGNANTAPATLNINTLGAVAIKRMPSGAVLGGAELSTTVPVTVMYNGTSFFITSAQITAPVGSTVEMRGTLAPTGYLIEDGSCVSQTTYAALFVVTSTSYGSCSAGLFALPDSRGTMFAALDNQGVNGAANRITSGGSGCNATAIGLCGNQSQTLTLSQLPTGLTVTGNVTVLSNAVNLVNASVSNPNFNFGAGGGSILTGLGSGGTAGQQTSQGTNTLTSNNTSGTAHPILNPASLGLRAIKF